MYDKDLAVHVLGRIYESTQIILERFRSVGSVDDFTNSPAGMEKLDSICMQLIALGESLKKPGQDHPRRTSETIPPY